MVESFHSRTEFSMLDRLMRLEAEYARFNRRRSLSRIDEGAVEIAMSSHGLVIRDASFLDNTYVNRLSIAASSQYVLDAPSDVQRIDVFSLVAATEGLSAIEGFEVEYSLNFFEHGLEIIPSREMNNDVRVELCQNPDLFLNEVGRSIGRAISEEIRIAKRSHYCSNEFRCYTAHLDDTVAGIATLYVQHGTGWLANAFTFEAFRNRGVQSALVQHRLDDCRTLGLRSAITDVEPDTTSERNVQRFGFKKIASAAVWEAVQSSSARQPV